MFIWEVIGTAYKVICVMAYISLALWTIAAVVNIIKYIKRRKGR